MRRYLDVGCEMEAGRTPASCRILFSLWELFAMLKLRFGAIIGVRVNGEYILET